MFYEWLSRPATPFGMWHSDWHMWDLRTFRSPTRHFSSHRSQAQHLKKTLPVPLCSLLLVQACPNKIRSHWLSSRRRGLRGSRNQRNCRNTLMIPMSIMASLVDISKGAPAIECRTGTWLVSPRCGPKKKKLEASTTKVLNCHWTSYSLTVT